jgi:aspartate/methionine/tyrosine aminotransferase
VLVLGFARGLAQRSCVEDAASVFSQRSASERQENALSAAAAALRQAGRSYLDLTGSNPTTVGLPFDDEAAQRALASARVERYSPLPFGLLSARAALAERYRSRGIAQLPEHIVLTASTSESYGFLFTLLADPGDQVLVPSPSYPLFEYLARFSGVVPIPYPLRYDGAWHVDRDALAGRVTARTRALVAVNPNNPTGSFVTREEWQHLATLGLPLISDEVFAGYPLSETATPCSVLSALPEPPVVVFALDGLSKSAGLPQYKLGSIAFKAPASVQGELCHRLELIADTYLSVASPVQAALPALLELAPARATLISARIKQNQTVLQRELGHGIATLLHADAGWSAVLRLPRLMSEQDWVLTLLQQHGVLVQPGWFYDFEQEPIVVLSLLGDEGEFARGVQAVQAALQ